MHAFLQKMNRDWLKFYIKRVCPLAYKHEKRPVGSDQSPPSPVFVPRVPAVTKCQAAHWKLASGLLVVDFGLFCAHSCSVQCYLLFQSTVDTQKLLLLPPSPICLLCQHSQTPSWTTHPNINPFFHRSHTFPTPTPTVDTFTPFSEKRRWWLSSGRDGRPFY